MFALVLRGKHVICRAEIFQVPESQGLDAWVKTVTSIQICLIESTNFQSPQKLEHC